MSKWFGTYTEYRTAPRYKVEEALIAWRAEQTAKADHERENAPKT